MALAMDEQEAMETGIRKIYCGLTEGSYFSYTGIFGIDAATADMLGGGRTQGKVAAQYDEFFFNAPDDPDGTVRHKDFASTPDGMTFLRQTETAQANTWYETSDGGKRIIYEPAQTHPWNHFSKHTTAYAVEFYTEAFKENNQNLNQIDANSQVWQLKEVFECVALVSFVFFIIGFASLLIELLFFNKVKTELNPLPSIERTGSKIGIFALLLCLILVPGVFFSALMDGGAEMLGVLFLVDLTFKADFRIWTFAFKTFDFNIFPTIFRYFPTFLAYYVVSTAAITINTNTEKMQGFKGYLLAIALNAGGGFLWLVHQYGMLFTTGVAAHPGSALSGIVLVAMIPTLSIAAIISRNLYKKTGSIWLRAVLNALLMTTMTIANTMVAFK